MSMNESYSRLVYDKDTPSTREGASWFKENIVAMLLLILLLGVIVILSFFSNRPKEELAIIERVKEEKTHIAERLFSSLSLEAKAYMVYDMSTGDIVYAQNKNAQLPLASLSKIMTAVVVSENLLEDDVVTINREDLLVEGDNGLLEGESWTVKSLSDFTLTVSSNDGASALASAVEAWRSVGGKDIRFVDLMNNKAKELYLKQTYFLNTSGLDIEESTQSGSYGSIEDITKLFAYALKNHPTLFQTTTDEEINFISKDNITHIVQNTNQSIRDIVGIFASKTGYTDLAGGNLVIAFDAGLMQPYIISVLGSSKEGRFTDVQKLYETTRRFLEAQNEPREVASSQ